MPSVVGATDATTSTAAGVVVDENGRSLCAWDCGGVVRALDWCAVRACDRAALLGEHRELLAVSAETHPGTLRETARTYRGPGAIQLWSVPCDNGTVLFAFLF